MVSCRSFRISVIAGTWLAAAIHGTIPASTLTENLSAVVIHVTERDLARLVEGALRVDEAGHVEGVRDRVSERVHGLRYSLDLSPPVFTLDESGAALIRMEILEADLRVQRLVGRVLSREAFCENAGVSIDRGRPANLTVGVRFDVGPEGLRIVPESVDLPGDAFRLVKPSRCGNTFVPTWLLWKLGKPYLRRHVDGLDEVLLERLRRSADRLAESGFLSRRWNDVKLFPSAVDTRQGSLLVSLAMSAADADADTPPEVAPPWSGTLGERSFLGVSERFANALLAETFSDYGERPLGTSGDGNRILESDAVEALIPGLRERQTRDGLYLTVAFERPPRLEFLGQPDAPAIVRVSLAGARLSLRDALDEDSTIGGVRLDRATIAVRPYRGVLGGISFELVENDWQVSSHGIRFDDDVLAAALQEIVFGEAFETRHEPMAREGVLVGRTRFDPRYFERVGEYLVIGLTGF